MSQRHAVITGGAGFIGSHLCQELLDAGWQVTALDDLSTGSKENLAAVAANPDFTLEIGDAGDPALVERLFVGSDVVFHLAAVVGVRKVMEDTVATIEKNLHTSEVVLKAAAKYGKRFLITSTSEVYGSNSQQAFREDDDSVIGNSRHRRWCYAAGKLLDEFHTYAHYYTNKLPATIVRLFNTIGPRQVGHYGMVVPTFVSQARRGEQMTVYGDGTQKRCFGFVKDVVRCLVGLIDCDAAIGEVFNIGSDQEISIMDLAKLIKEKTASKSEIVKLSYKEVFGEDFVDMERRRPDVSKLRKTLGYAPDTSLSEILDAIIIEGG